MGTILFFISAFLTALSIIVCIDMIRSKRNIISEGKTIDVTMKFMHLITYVSFVLCNIAWWSFAFICKSL